MIIFPISPSLPLPSLPLSRQLKHTREFMELARYQSVAANTKIYFGPNLPSFFLQGRDDGMWLPRQQQTVSDS